MHDFVLLCCCVIGCLGKRHECAGVPNKVIVKRMFMFKMKYFCLHKSFHIHYKYIFLLLSQCVKHFTLFKNTHCIYFSVCTDYYYFVWWVCARFHSLPGLDGSASQEAGAGDGSSSLGDDGEDPLGLSTDSLSRLRSPSVMEVREKGYERLKEELAKAQRVSDGLNPA